MHIFYQIHLKVADYLNATTNNSFLKISVEIILLIHRNTILIFIGWSFILQPL